MNDRANFSGQSEDRIEVLIAAFERVDERLGREHAENLSTSAEFQKDVNGRLDALQRAFPGGDPEGHRRFHEALIEQAAARAKFWRDLTDKLLQQGIWAVITGCFVAAGWAFVQWIRSVR